MKQDQLSLIDSLGHINSDSIEQTTSLAPSSIKPPLSFEALYDLHLKHLLLQGLRTKTRDAYSRAIRQLGARFDYQIEALREGQLVEYFSEFLQTHSRSTVRLAYCGIRFFYKHVLKNQWPEVPLVKATHVTRIPDIVTAEEAEQLFANTDILSYRIFFYTVYSMGLRLSEGLKLKLGDIDAKLMRVHIRDSKGGKDRFVPLPNATLQVLRRFWKIHRNPVYLFPNRLKKQSGVRFVESPLDRGSVQQAMRKALQLCTFKKRLQYTVFAIATPHI